MLTWTSTREGGTDTSNVIVMCLPLKKEWYFTSLRCYFLPCHYIPSIVNRERRRREVWEIMKQIKIYSLARDLKPSCTVASLALLYCSATPNNTGHELIYRLDTGTYHTHTRGGSLPYNPTHLTLPYCPHKKNSVKNIYEMFWRQIRK